LYTQVWGRSVVQPERRAWAGCCCGRSGGGHSHTGCRSVDGRESRGDGRSGGSLRRARTCARVELRGRRRTQPPAASPSTASATSSSPTPATAASSVSPPPRG